MTPTADCQFLECIPGVQLLWTIFIAAWIIGALILSAVEKRRKK